MQNIKPYRKGKKAHAYDVRETWTPVSYGVKTLNTNIFTSTLRRKKTTYVKDETCISL